VTHEGDAAAAMVSWAYADRLGLSTIPVAFFLVRTGRLRLIVAAGLGVGKVTHGRGPRSVLF
jgi:hypothetical protein